MQSINLPPVVTSQGGRNRSTVAEKVITSCPIVQLVQPEQLGPGSATAVGNNGHLKVLCEADNVLGEILAT